jgi:streptogramin lyase
VGSTELTARLGDGAAREIIEAQREIVRKHVAARAGREIDAIGDGFMIAFDSTRRAIACAVDIQRELLRRGQQPGALQLRIGLNVGEVLERDGHPFGAAVNAAARVAASAGPGQVIVADAVRQLAGTIPGIDFRDRGRVKLKGFAERRRLYQVVWQDDPLPVSVERAPTVAERPRGKRVLVLAGGLALMAAIAAGVVIAVWAGGDASPPTVVPNAVVRIDPVSKQPSAVLDIGDEPDLVVAAANTVWVLNDADRTVSRIDARTNDAMTVGGGLAPCGMAADPSGDLWVASCTGTEIAPTTTILRLDATDGRVKDSVSVAATTIGTFRALAYGGGAVWISNPDPENDAPQSVTRIDVKTKQRQRFRVGRLPAAMAYADGALWVANLRDPSISRVLRAADDVETIRFLGVAPSSIAISGDTVWVGDFDQGMLWRFDARQLIHDGSAVIPVRAPSGTLGVAAGAGSIWTTAPEDGTLWQVDPDTNQPVRIHLGHRPTGVAFANGSVWVAVDDVG